MIKTDRAYERALERLQTDRESLSQEEQHLIAEGLSPEEVERAMAPQRTFYSQLRDEVAWYESVRRGDKHPVYSLRDLGRLLIGLRIASGLSQRELAERLDVHESQVSRDERNEYYGIGVERAQEIIDALNGEIEIAANPREQRELQPA